MPTPHRVLDELIDGLVGGVENVGRGVAGAIRGAGANLTTALDKPIQMVAKKEGPHHIVDRVLTSAIEAGQSFVEGGVIGSAKTLGKGLMKALDHPSEQMGIPPSEIDKIPKIKPPEIFKKR